MRTITLSYDGLGDIEIQIATGKKLIECQKMADALPERKENQTEEEMEKELKGMCEIIAKCTKFNAEEVFDNFGFKEIQEIFNVIMGDRETIKKARKQA